MSSQQDLLDKRPRGRPSKARLEQLKVEAHKRMRMDAGGDVSVKYNITGCWH